jgi:hypothetical protein
LLIGVFGMGAVKSGHSAIGSRQFAVGSPGDVDLLVFYRFLPVVSGGGCSVFCCFS